MNDKDFLLLNTAITPCVSDATVVNEQGYTLPTCYSPQLLPFHPSPTHRMTGSCNPSLTSITEDKPTHLSHIFKLSRERGCQRDGDALSRQYNCSQQPLSQPFLQITSALESSSIHWMNPEKVCKQQSITSCQVRRTYNMV